MYFKILIEIVEKNVSSERIANSTEIVRNVFAKL